MADLNAPIPLEDGGADAVVSVETIEHLENPRAFMRELVRLVRPAGWSWSRPPNQLSLLSKLTLVIKNRFNAFTDADYPAHITALLESDLRRVATECGLDELETAFTNSWSNSGQCKKVAEIVWALAGGPSVTMS